MKISKKLFPFLLFFVLAGFVQCGTKSKNMPDKAVNKAENKKAEDIKETFATLGFKVPNNPKITKFPDFEIEDITGNKVKSSVFKGKVIFLTFWATWCPFCSKELPTTEKLYQKTKDNPNFSVVSVCLNQDKDSIPLYAEMQGYNFPILLDPDNILYKRFRDELRTPVTYLIAKDSTIVGEIISSAHDWSTARAFNFFTNISKRETLTF